MAMLVDCLDCQAGLHEEHREVVKPPPAGGVGGDVCMCTGDCAERNRPCEGCKHPLPDCICWYLAELTAGVRDESDA